MTSDSPIKCQVYYKGSLDDGTVFDSVWGEDPFEFCTGKGEVIKGFEEAVKKMKAGETTKNEIPCEQAYGPTDPAKIVVFERKNFPAEIPSKIGAQLILRDSEGREMPALVTDANDEEITLDANHPLAGENLTFEIKLLTSTPA